MRVSDQGRPRAARAAKNLMDPTHCAGWIVAHFGYSPSIKDGSSHVYICTEIN